MKTSKQAKMYAAIQQHGEKLNAIFNTGLEPIELCKKLRRLELKQYRTNEDYCNAKMDTQEWEAATEKTTKSLVKILGSKAAEICFINGDPRGYSLKCKSQSVRGLKLDIQTDWGGYGLIAPDLTPN